MPSHYPVISLAVFILCRCKWYYKVAGLAFSVVLIGWSVLYTISETQRVTGTQQFSPFGGWQLANNALYMYQQVAPSARAAAPAKLALLEKMVDQHMDTLSRVRFSHDDQFEQFFLSLG